MVCIVINSDLNNPLCINKYMHLAEDTTVYSRISADPAATQCLKYIPRLVVFIDGLGYCIECSSPLNLWGRSDECWSIYVDKLLNENYVTNEFETERDSHHKYKHMY